MKTPLLIAILILLSFNVVLSQIFVNGVDLNNEDIRYCQIVGATKKVTKSTLDITIDYGQKHDPFKNQEIIDEKGNEVNFNSMADALNFMTKRDWELVSTYATSTGSNNQMILYFLIRKKE